MRELSNIIKEEFFGEEVKVLCTNGQIRQGILDGYTSAEDNEPDEESIDIKEGNGFLTEIYNSEIVSVELAK